MALHAKAKAEAGYRFYALYDKIGREDILAHAYAQCRSNKGASGVDGQDFADIEAYGVQRWLMGLVGWTTAWVSGGTCPRIAPSVFRSAREGCTGRPTNGFAGDWKGSSSPWAGALSPQHLMSRPASGRLTALLKRDVEQLKEAVAAPRSNAGPLADGRIPSVGRQMPDRRLQKVAGAFPRG